MRPTALALALTCLAASAWPQTETDRLRGAKALFFDRKYSEAREAWQGILASGKGPDADAALYWIARCSENLGETERAFKENGDFLDRRPADAALAEEARTRRVSLAARLCKSGKKSYLPVLQQALSDPSKTVRYFAALQLAGLPGEEARGAIPLLKKILSDEKDDDLVDRAKLHLLRLDPGALAPAQAPPAGPRREASWLKVRIFKKGEQKPSVSVNLPVAFAEMLFKSLPDEAREGLRKKGYDSDNFWDRLKKMGPTQILDIDGEDERVQIWLE